MATQTFYTRGDKAVVNSFIEEMERERDILVAAFQAIRDSQQVEHDVDFADHAVPAAPELRTRGAISAMMAVGGFVTVNVPVAPGAIFDVLVGGVSILAAPISGAALAPGVPVPLVFTAAPTAAAGAKIDYLWIDGGAPSFQVSANVRWSI